MKIYLRTDKIRVSPPNDQQYIGPDLNGYEQDSEVRYSVYDEEPGAQFIVCVAAAPAVISNVEGLASVDVLSDDDLETVMATHSPGVTAAGLDVADPEIDGFLSAEGFDPRRVRRAVQRPAYGTAVFQTQEYLAVRTLMRARSIDDPTTEKYDLEDRFTRGDELASTAREAMEGRRDAQEVLLKDVRDDVRDRGDLRDGQDDVRDSGGR